MNIAGSVTARCGRPCRFYRRARSSPIAMGGFPVRSVERLCLAHFWVAFAAFLVAALLGAWQMWVRSPLGANIGTPSQYFLSVTAHGVAMAYVLTTFFIMGFGYFRCGHGPCPSASRQSLGVGRLLGSNRRRGPGGRNDLDRPGLGTLHVLSAADRQPLVLYRPSSGGDRIVGLVRADARRDAGVEARKPGASRSARNVRHRGP